MSGGNIFTKWYIYFYILILFNSALGELHVKLNLGSSSVQLFIFTYCSAKGASFYFLCLLFLKSLIFTQTELYAIWFSTYIMYDHYIYMKEYTRSVSAFTIRRTCREYKIFYPSSTLLNLINVSDSECMCTLWFCFYSTCFLSIFFILRIMSL